MRLSDILSGADLTLYPKVAMALFIAVFVSVLFRTFAASRRSHFTDMASLPLDLTDAPAPTADAPETRP